MTRIILSPVIYLCAFALPVFGTPSPLYGIQAFALAWCPPYTPLWLANPLYWWALLQARRRRLGPARRASLAAVCLASVPVPVLSRVGVIDKPLQVGYYVWVVAIAVLWLGTWAFPASGDRGDSGTPGGAGSSA